MKSSSAEALLNQMMALERSGALAQVLLISGGEEWQSTIRQELARLFLCEGGGAGGCTCRSCRTDLAAHPDYLELAPEPRTIAREAVRQAIGTLSAAPLWSRFKTIVIAPADTLGREAESYLLKHLEEPPPYARYLLMTEAPDAIIATIRSRCQLWRFNENSHAGHGERDMSAELRTEPLTVERVVDAAYWARRQYRQSGQAEWLAAWEALSEACHQLELNGNEDLVRTRILRAWPRAVS